MLFMHYEIKAESGPPGKISRAAIATLSKDRTGVFQKVSAEAGGMARRTSMDDDTDVAMRATLEEEIITAVQNKSR
jgi:hypothetical protein